MASGFAQHLRIAVVGAGPVGLALSLQAAEQLPQAELTLFDTRSLEQDVGRDARTLALSLGSVQLLQRLRCWPAERAQAIDRVHVSQAPPSLVAPWGDEATVQIEAGEQGVEQLGAVLPYGALVAPLQKAWLEACARAPQRLRSRFGQAVSALEHGPGSAMRLSLEGCDQAQTFDLAIVAEGGVFAEQSRKALRHDYGQTAWVGSARLQADGQTLPHGTAFERFTQEGPLALLPLPALEPAADAGTPAASSSSSAPPRRAALVWCVGSADDPVAPLDEAQRIAVLNARLPPQAGKILTLGPLKAFALGLNAESSLVQGRCVRIGNAAQTLHPVAGQGLNLGLRDAYSLVQALRFGSDVDAALRRVAWQRAPDRWGMIASTDFLARSFTWRAPGLASARGLGLAAVQALPGLKRALARQMMFGQR
jgi:2-octaprenyl-6-methoxyphenol hydroxylase